MEQNSDEFGQTMKLECQCLQGYRRLLHKSAPERERPLYMACCWKFEIKGLLGHQHCDISKEKRIGTFIKMFSIDLQRVIQCNSIYISTQKITFLSTIVNIALFKNTLDVLVINKSFLVQTYNRAQRLFKTMFLAVICDST